MWVSLNWIAGKLCKIPWHAATKVSSWINEHNCGAFLPTNFNFRHNRIGKKNDPFKMNSAHCLDLDLNDQKMRHYF